MVEAANYYRNVTFSKVNSFMALMVVVSIFSRELGKGSLFGLDFDWISYPFYVLFFLGLLLTNRFFIDKFIFSFFIVILFGGIYSKLYLNLALQPFFKQFLPIFVIFSSVSYVIRRNDIQSLFELYIKGVVLSAILGVIQLILKLFGIKFLTQFSWINIDSIAEEPSHYAAILLPGIVYCLINYKIFKKEFYLLIFTLIFTFNLTAYVVFSLMLLIVYRKIYYLLLVLPILGALGVYLYNIDPLIKFRIDESANYLITQDIKNTHGTPLSFFSNLQVALNNVKLNPISGSGLGGHEEMYYKYFSNNPFSRLDYLFGLNAKSAHSLSIRVLSEIGVVGFLLFIYNLCKVFLIEKNTKYYAIALASFSHFLCKTLKLGNYFDLGTPFFFLMIVYAYIEYNNSKLYDKVH